ncbi:MAG TPA: hypothetical protein VGG95_05390 [Edaphobacter sp.]
MRSLLRSLYRGMIHLHPASFRGEFGEEMLWIFDEETSNGRILSLFLDASRSVVLQRVRLHTKKTAPVAYYVEIDSALPAQRIAQATLAAIYFGTSLLLALAPLIFWLVTAVNHSYGTHYGGFH